MYMMRASQRKKLSSETGPATRPSGGFVVRSERVREKKGGKEDEGSWNGGTNEGELRGRPLYSLSNLLNAVEAIPLERERGFDVSIRRRKRRVEGFVLR